MMSYKDGEILVKFRPTITCERLEAVIDRHRLVAKRLMPMAKCASLFCEVGREEAVCIAISLDEDVEYAKRMQQSIDVK